MGHGLDLPANPTISDRVGLALYNLRLAGMLRMHGGDPEQVTVTNVAHGHAHQESLAACAGRRL